MKCRVAMTFPAASGSFYLRAFLLALGFSLTVLLLPVRGQVPVPEAPTALPPCMFVNGGLNPQPLSESGVPAPTGYLWSELQHDAGNMSEANLELGFLGQQGYQRLADDFAVTQQCVINSVAFYAFTFEPAIVDQQPQITGYTLQIWNGRPGDAGSSVVFGDPTTNRLSQTTDAAYYRISNSLVPPPGEPPFLLFKIQRSVVRVETILQPGTYWLDWAAMVSSGVIVHPCKTVAQSRGTPGDNARTFNVVAGTWGNVIDIGDPETAPDVPQDFPFEVIGSPSSRKPFDFDGDGKTDISIFRPSLGEWWYLRSSDGGHWAAQFGSSSDTLVPGDYTGDGKADVAVYRDGTWLILRSNDFSYYAFPFGLATDIPVPADFDGDNRADAAVFRPSTGEWFRLRSSNGVVEISTFGSSIDQPVPADFDGDRKADLAIYRPTSGEWWLNRSSLGGIVFSFGSAADRTVQGDYTGDGKADVAFYRNGWWYVLRSNDYSFYSFPFGTVSDIPVPGDYDGDGRTDAAVFRSSEANWYVNRSTAGTMIEKFGTSTDKPVPNAYVK